MEQALKQVAPQFDIYAHDTRDKIHVAVYGEFHTLLEIQRELFQLRADESAVTYKKVDYWLRPPNSTLLKESNQRQFPLVSKLNVEKLEGLLDDARSNYDLVYRGLEELRAFIKANIPFDVK